MGAVGAHAISEKGLSDEQGDDRDKGSLCALKTLTSTPLSSYRALSLLSWLSAIRYQSVLACLTHTQSPHLGHCLVWCTSQVDAPQSFIYSIRVPGPAPPFPAPLTTKEGFLGSLQ